MSVMPGVDSGSPKSLTETGTKLKLGVAIALMLMGVSFVATGLFLWQASRTAAGVP